MSYVAMTNCFFCGEGKDILLHKRFGNLDKIDGKCLDYEPCQKCAEYMKQGVILISVDESKSDDIKNPYRTGGWIVMTKEGFKKLPINPPELQEEILRKGVCFIPDDAWKMLGLDQVPQTV